MPVFEGEGGPAPCPTRVAVIGGGRWARVLAGALCELVPSTVSLSVHSPRNAAAMASWAEAQGWGRRIDVSPAWPRTGSHGTGAVLVVNAARDHEAAVDWAISAGVPVMVEKPIALTASAANRLVARARARSVPLAAAHVFRFARYVENLAKLVADAGPVESLDVDWADPFGEQRHGEPKRYDPSLPVFADCLPHVVAIAGSTLNELPGPCRSVDVRRGGASVVVELAAGRAGCRVRMERNAPRRRRIVEAVAGGETFVLDFSTEPGTIRSGPRTIASDASWDSGMRPVARMLAAFLRWAATGEPDDRLDVEPGLRACEIADEVRGPYRSALLPWLTQRLAASGPLDEDVRYALAELVQAEGPLPNMHLERELEAVRARFAGEGEPWLAGFVRARDAARLRPGGNPGAPLAGKPAP